MDEIDNILQGNYTDARLKLTSVKSAVFFASGQERDFLLSFTDKILLLLDELWSDTASLNASVSSLRYILEALVKTERFLQDDEYLKVFYSQYLFDHKTRLLGLKKRLEKEIELLDKYIYKESKILSALSTIEDYDDKVQKNIDDLYKELDSEFSVYLINAKIHGFDFLKYHLETKQLPGLIESINKLESGIKAEGLTESKTYTRLRDEFKAYNLQDEYDFTYSYTSDLIHCRSYSINTPLEMDIIEKQMFKTMSLNFVNKIASNLLKLGDMPEGIRYFRKS